MNDVGNRPGLLIYSHGELLGDALLKLPTIVSLRHCFPQHHITWMAGTGFTFYARKLSPLVDGLIDDVREDVRLGQTWSELWRPPLRNVFYDVIIDTQNKIKSSLILKQIPHRLFVSPTANFLFSDRKPDEPHKQGSVQRRLLQLFTLASGVQAQADYTVTLPDACRKAARISLPEGSAYIGLAPGSGVEKKCWPLKSFIQLAKLQADAGRTPVFFLGPKEAHWLDQIKAEVPQCRFPEQENTDQDLNPVLFSMALAELIQVGVANDSGTGHIFASGGQPLISLFGHSNAEKFVHDRENRQTILARDYGGTEMWRIPVAAVSEAIESVLAKQT